MRHEVRWEITSAYSTWDAVLKKLLDEYWEPFAVSSDDKIWLRKPEYVIVGELED